jgi:hypothetical protein
MDPGIPGHKIQIELGDNRREGRSKVKPIKMLGLAALAALMAMAFVGASSAMAESTELCGSDPGTGSTEACGKGGAQEAVTHVHETTLSGAPESLLSSNVEILCDVLFLGDTVGSTSNPVEILGNFTYSNCMTASNGSCTITEVSSDFKLNVLKLGHELADVSPVGVGGQLNLHCGFLINCTYDGEGLTAHALGPLLSGTETNGQTRIEEQTTHRVSGVCPETAKLDLLTTPLEATYLTNKGALHYCVEYSRANTGFYLNSTCTTRDSTRAGKFALVVSQAGLTVGTPLCVNLSNLVGLYSDSACSVDPGTGTSLYEKGIIKTVQ